MEKHPHVNQYISSAGREKRSRRMAHLLIGSITIICVILIALSYVVLKTGLFRIESVDVSGNSTVLSEDIISALQSQEPGGNIVRNLLGFRNILIWGGDAENKLRFLPQVKELKIEKDYWNRKVNVYVTERMPYGIWCYGGGSNCFWFDDGGVAFKKGLASEGNLIKTVNDLSGGGVGIGGEVLERDNFASLRSVFDVLEGSGLSVVAVNVADLSLGEVLVKLDGGPDLYFSLRFSSGGSLPLLNNLKSFANFYKFKYIDFRVQNRAYYK